MLASRLRMQLGVEHLQQQFGPEANGARHKVAAQIAALKESVEPNVVVASEYGASEAKGRGSP